MLALMPSASGGGVWPGPMFSRPTLAGTSTCMPTSPTVLAFRKNSSKAQSRQSCIGPTPRRLATISAPMPPLP
ncbi:hypothetical protein D3C81_1234520 [compost metagenome]